MYIIKSISWLYIYAKAQVSMSENLRRADLKRRVTSNMRSDLYMRIRLINANQTYKCEPDKMQVNVDEVRLPKTRVRYSAHIALR